MRKWQKLGGKFLSVFLAAVMLLATGFTAVGSYIGTNVLVSADEPYTYGQFQYYDLGSAIRICGYLGSGSVVAFPQEIYGNRLGI